MQINNPKIYNQFVVEKFRQNLVINFMALKDDLKEFGLDDKKARVYLALLEMGQAKAHEIAVRARVARPTAYDLLEKLSEEGLVGAYEKHKIRYYIVNDPAESFYRPALGWIMAARMDPDQKVFSLNLIFC